jgi:hypothetical protein
MDSTMRTVPLKRVPVEAIQNRLALAQDDAAMATAFFHDIAQGLAEKPEPAT